MLFLSCHFPFVPMPVFPVPKAIMLENRNNNSFFWLKFWMVYFTIFCSAVYLTCSDPEHIKIVWLGICPRNQFAKVSLTTEVFSFAFSRRTCILCTLLLSCNIACTQNTWRLLRYCCGRTRRTPKVV